MRSWDWSFRKRRDACSLQSCRCFVTRTYDERDDMKHLLLLAIPVFFLIAIAAWNPATTSSTATSDEACVDCHSESSPGIVSDWRTSKHFQEGVSCSDCHGGEHKTADDSDNAFLPTPETCGECHDDRVAQFSKGKHALAWTVMKAMPTFPCNPRV